ncbi:MAG: murein biosynthesis integral membrane protein MurJ [Deltaproteobacteria bacterium]|jgi:putative peptidoglycan lipid II flippase|nr:murein biosynthesis integral membrane protein MurJ [Deltaproteobacteria bacterium]
MHARQTEQPTGYREKSRIARATGIMAIATLLSRFAGLVRDIVVGTVFGAGFATDAFFVAFTIPNLLRRFFAEGSLTAAFVPTFTDVYQHDGVDAARKMARICWTLLLCVMVCVTVLGVLASPWIVQLIGYGFADTAGKLALTDLLNRIMFPYIFFVSLLALFAGILNVCGHFLMPALSPLLLNLAMIACALVLAPQLDQPILALAIGVAVGGVVQLVMQMPAIYRCGFDLRFDFYFRHPAVTRVARLMLPGLAGVAIYQINVVVTRLLASFLPEGSVSWLYYGQRLFEFPQGIFVVSLAQAVLPTMSRQQAVDDLQGFQESLRFALVLIAIITLPASIGLILCSDAVYSLFFMRGAFTAFDVSQSAAALIWYAPGLLFVGISRVTAPAFYALKDTRTPVKISFWTLLINVAAGLLLMQVMGHAGLALALTLATVFNAVVLIWLLGLRLNQFDFASIGHALLRLTPGLFCMVLVVKFLLGFVNWMEPGDFWPRLGLLTAAIGLGGGSYGLLSLLCGVHEVRQAWRMLLQKVVPPSRGTNA